VAGVCVIGLQWGDEAKGKLVDLLTGQFDIVVRYQGGANAGHTVVFGGKTYKLHQIPSGVLTPGVMNIVGPGVVLNPPVIIQEMDRLIGQGVTFEKNLMLSDRAHVVLPWHIAEDQAMDKSTTDGESIGTTLRGIGPCYRDKVGRSYAVRLGDFYRDNFRQRIECIAEAKRQMLAGLNSQAAFELDPAQIVAEFTRHAERLRPFVGDTTEYLLSAVENGKRLLFEGAQGALLDVDHGTYPFVTSSNSSGVGVSAGSGVPGRWIEKVIGVIKAYTTRVGGGPFPTELKDEIGNQIRERGREYGTTTGRPRRCGWFDAVAVRYTARLSGVSALSLMMMDVLCELPEIKICVAYEIDGVRTDRFPSHADDLRRARPVYEMLPGWQEDVSHVRRMEDFPPNALAYMERISQIVGRPVEVVSVGPDREQTVFAAPATRLVPA
jgi:adenylosuccinate synthase